MLEWPIEKYTWVIGVLIAYVLAIILFLIGTYKLYNSRNRYNSIVLMFAVLISLIFWFDLHKSPIVASATVENGDMTDFDGELILRKNGNCEIWSYGILGQDKFTGKYNIQQNIVFLSEIEETWVNEFDTITIDSKIYVVILK